MLIEKQNCYGCGGHEFEVVSGVSLSSELLVCSKCGAVMHNTADRDEAKQNEFYRKSYRAAPTHENLLTTTVKQNMISTFLREFLAGKKGLICTDIGAATGYIPNWLRSLGHKATGTEYTTTFRRVSEHYYGIPLTEEIEEKHRYDLITIYHVLEHMMNPFDKLVKYRSLLADGGHMMISVPEWFNYVEEGSGGPIVSADNHFHVNHINVFSAQSIKNMFARVGLEVVKEDHISYGQTYLLKKCEPVDSIKSESAAGRVEDILKIKRAIDKLTAKDYNGAISEWGNFPEAHIAVLLDTYGKEECRQEDYISMVEEKYPRVAQCPRWQYTVAAWNYTHNRTENALRLFTELCKISPKGDYFGFIGFCHQRMGDYIAAMGAFERCQLLTPTRWAEMANLILHCAAKLPTWDERAIEHVKEQLYQQNKGHIPIEPNDPTMK